MPGRVRVHRLSPEKEGEYKMRILSILNEFEEAMTIDEIKSQDMILQPLTSQKMARLIGNLIEMLRKWQPYAKLVVFSASQEERYPYIADYLNQNNIPFDAINEDVLIEKRKPTRKLYYNILLDDRAGLGSAYAALDMLYNRLEAKGELKTWRA